MRMGKTLTMFLIDDSPTGRIKCTVANWTGVVYKIPRADVERCKNREDLKQSGVYFLFGNETVYIGQAGNRKNGDGILNRLIEHRNNSNKDFWQEAIVITDKSFGATEISFLENKFCNLALNARRYNVKNNNEPALGNITEEKESELEEFADYVLTVISILGYKIFEPIKETPPAEIPNEPIFYLSRRNKTTGFVVEARCKALAGKFMLLAGSKISPNFSKNASDKVKKARRKAKIGVDNILSEDIIFDTSSSAAEFVTGTQSAQGPEVWKTADGITLKKFFGDNNV